MKGEGKMTGIELIAEERKRQIEKEGFNAEHDEEHGLGTLGSAALCYLEHAIGRAWLIDDVDDGIEEYIKEEVPNDWPAAWALEGWKPKDPIKDLVRAGALIAAEIDNRLRKKG